MLFYLLLSSAILFAQAEKDASDPVFENLDHGYRVAHVSVDLRECKTCFETIAHYNDLYDGETKLGRFGAYSVSPSGRFVVWEDQSMVAREVGGRLLLRDRNTRQTHDVTQRPYALPRFFEWDEARYTLTVSFYSNSENKKPKPSVIKLNEELTTK